MQRSRLPFLFTEKGRLFFWKGNNMKIIIIQGMTCLGKSTLCLMRRGIKEKYQLGENDDE